MPRRSAVVGGGGQVGVGLQDALLQLGELGARVHAELVGEQPPGVGVHRERLGLPSAAVQRQHQQLAQPLAQRVRGGQRGQLGDRLRVAADLQIEVEPGLDEEQVPLLQPGALGLRVRAGQSGQRFAVPQVQRLDDQLAGPAPVAGVLCLLGLGGQLLGQLGVEGADAVSGWRSRPTR